MATDTQSLILVIDGELQKGTEFSLALGEVRELCSAIESVHDKDTCELARIVIAKARERVKEITALAEPERLRLQRALNELRTQRDKMIGEFEALIAPIDRQQREWTIAEQDAARAEQEKLNKGQRAENRVVVKPDTPSVSGARFVPHYDYEVADAKKIKRDYLVPNAVKIREEIRKAAKAGNPKYAEKVVGGIRVTVS